jgi:putative transposase
MILFGEASLQHVLTNYTRHDHSERNHQGQGNVILFLEVADRIGETSGTVRRRDRLGGLPKFYYREAA